MVFLVLLISAKLSTMQKVRKFIGWNIGQVTLFHQRLLEWMNRDIFKTLPNIYDGTLS